MLIWRGFTASMPINPQTGRVIVNDTLDKLTEPTSNLSLDSSSRQEIHTSAWDTLGGATSKELNRGLGAPIQGMSSRERHTANQQPHRKREHEGSAQYGPQGGPVDLNNSRGGRWDDNPPDASGFARYGEGEPSP